MLTLNCGGKLLTTDRPLVMGILNSTPDSFFGASRVASVEAVLQRAAEMLSAGADILDIGGQSTRPGAEEVGPQQELDRIIPAIESIAKRFPEAVISVDTWYARVAEISVAAGAAIVNDVSGGQLDDDMIGTVAKLGTPYICMHMKGRPSTMAKENHYDNLIRDILDYFIQQIAACRAAGIRDIIIDPGIGFAKDRSQNLQLLGHLKILRKITGCPLLLGVSRKSTIYKTLNIAPEQALNGTTVLNTIGLLNGADILRVHDVKEAREAVILTDLYKANKT